jgi:hypothetical protein
MAQAPPEMRDHLRKLLTDGAVDRPAPWWVMQLVQIAFMLIRTTDSNQGG